MFEKQISVRRSNQDTQADHTLGASVNEGLEREHIIWVNHLHQRGIDPSSRLNAVQAADDDLELHVVLLVLILYCAVVRCDFDTLHSGLNKSRGHFGLRPPDVRLSKEELTIEVRDVDDV